MSLSKYLNMMLREDDGDSKAAEQAKTLGLTHAGYGYWKDKNGETVARTIKGHLVKLTPNERELAAWRDEADLATRIPYINFDDKPESSAQSNDLPFFNFDDMDKTAKRQKDWFGSSSTELGKKIADVFEKKEFNDGQDICKTLAEIIDVDTNVTYGMYSKSLKEFEDKYGLRSHGLYEPSREEIYLSDDISNALDMATYTNGSLAQQYRAALTGQNKLFPKISKAISTVVHESVHAKDPALIEDDVNRFPPALNEKFIYITEGLTEYKTRTIVNATFSDIYKNKQITYTSYDREVRAVHALASMDQKIVNELWDANDRRDRVNKLDVGVKKALQTAWEARSDAGDMDAETFDKISGFVGTWISRGSGVDLFTNDAFADVVKVIKGGFGHDLDELLTAVPELNILQAQEDDA